MKFLKALLLSTMVLSTSVYAECEFTVDDMFFGDVMIQSEPEFITGGFITAACEQDDLGKVYLLQIDKNYLSSVSDSSKIIPLDIELYGNPWPINTNAVVVISNVLEQMPVNVKINTANVNANLPIGLYSSRIQLTVEESTVN